MALQFRRFLSGIQLLPQNTISPDTAGEMRYNSGSGRLELYDGVLRSVTTDNGTATLTNKTIDGNNNTITNVAAGSITGVVRQDGTTPLTANWNAGAFSGTFNSVAVGSSANTVSGLSTIVNTGTLTLPTSTDTLVGRATTDTLTNKSISGLTNTLTNIQDGSLASSFVKANGTVPLTANWNAGAFTITANSVNLGSAANTISGLSAIVNGAGQMNVNSTGTITVPNATDTLVGRNTTDTLTNKTLTSPAINGGTITSASLVTPTVDVLSTTEQGSTPSTPAAGTRKVYSKADGLYQLDSTGAETKVGTGSSINYITNPDAAANTSGWVTYADAAGVLPVDGTGGSPTITFTRNTSSPLRGTADFLITKTAVNSQGQGVSTDFTIDLADRGQMVEIDFDYSASANFTYGDSSDIRVYVYDITNALLITPTKTFISSSRGTNRTSFQASSNSSSYRLILHIATTSALAYTMQLDRVIAMPVTAGSLAVISAYKVGTLRLTQGAAGFFVTTTSSAFNDFNQSGTFTTSIAGTGISQQTSKFGIVIAAPPGPGTYQVRAQFNPDSSSGNTQSIRITDGTNNSGSLRYIGNTGSEYQEYIASFDYSSSPAANLTFTVQGASDNAQVLQTNALTSDAIILEVYYFPPAALASAQASIIVEPPLSDWVDGSALFTPNNFGTVTAKSIWYRRDGDTMHVRGIFTSGTPAAATASISLPTLYPMNPTKIGTATNAFTLGYGSRLQAGNGVLDSNNLTAYFFDGSDATRVFMTNDQGTTTGQYDKVNASANYASGRVATFNFSYPVLGWTSNLALAVGIVGPQKVILQDVKATNVSGGTFTSGAYQTRVLNTTINPTNATFMSLATNQFTLAPGTYEIDWSAPAYVVDQHKTRLRNITDSTTDAMGSMEYANVGVTNRSTGSTVIRIGATKTFEIQHLCQTTKATNGFGPGDTIADSNIYTIVSITKMS